jgi:hypothetical protein
MNLRSTTTSCTSAQSTTTTFTRLTRTAHGSVAVQSEVGLGVHGASWRDSCSPLVRARHRAPTLPLPWRPTSRPERMHGFEQAKYLQTEVWDVSSTSSSSSVRSLSSASSPVFLSNHRDETGLRYRKIGGSLQAQGASLPVGVDIAEYHGALWSGTDASGDPRPSQLLWPSQRTCDVFGWLSESAPARFSPAEERQPPRGRGVQREFTF